MPHKSTIKSATSPEKMVKIVVHLRELLQN